MRIHVVSCLVLALAISVPSVLAQDSSPPAAKPAKKAGEKAQAGILEFEGKSFSKQQVLNRMRLMAQLAKWDKLDGLSQIALEKGAALKDEQILAFGNWYRALLAGHNQKADEAMDYLKKAIEHCFKNVDAMVSEEPLGILQTRADFQAIVEKLRRELDQGMRDRFQAVTDVAFGTPPENAGSLVGAIQAAGGGPLAKPGVPTILVLSRVNHDGFPKVVSLLQAAQAKLSLQLPVALLFYQYDTADARRVELTKSYVRQVCGSDSAMPWAVVGRAQYKEVIAAIEARRASTSKLAAARAASSASAPCSLGDADPAVEILNYFPVIVFLDASGAPLRSIEGVPADWQVENSLQKLAALPRAEPAAPPPAEAPPATGGAPAAEATPPTAAPEPVEPAPAPAPPPSE